MVQPLWYPGLQCLSLSVLYEEVGMPANRKPLSRKALSVQDRQFEDLLRRAANYQKTRRRASTSKVRATKVRGRAQKRTRAA